MSFAALAWASKYRANSAAEKLVLFAYADRHNEDTGSAYPSLAWLCEFTSLNRKTVIAAIGKLEMAGILTDTGQRMGSTKQIKVYSVNVGDAAEIAKRHYIYRLEDTETGEFYIGVRSCFCAPEADTYMGSGRWPTGAAFRGSRLSKQILECVATREEAEVREANLIAEAMLAPLCKNIAKEYHKRDRSITVPKKGLSNSPKNGRKQYRKRYTEPSSEPSSSEAKASSDKPALQPEHVLDEWNQVAERHGLPKVRRLIGPRLQKLKARIRDHPLDDWMDAFNAIERNPWMHGDNDRGWRVDFDFLLQPNSFQKLIEGSYDRAQSIQRTQ